MAVSGYAAVFEDETVIGGAFAERVAKGAFDGADMSNTVALFNHDMNQPLARVGRGLELTVDERGLRYSFELGNQSYAKDLAENIRMGNVGTSSFGFTVEDDNWERRDDGVNLRTINKVGLLFDVSPTTQGAYPTTEVGLRSMELALENEEVLKIEDEEVRNELEDQEVREEETNEEEEEQEERAPGYDSDYDGVKDEDEEEEEEEEERMSEEEDEEEEEGEEEERSASTPECGDCNCDGDCANNENPEPEARNNNISNSKNMKEKNPAPAIIQGMGDTEGKLKKRYSFGKAIQEAAKGGLTGLEAEMSQEARSEFSDAKVNVSGGFSVPSFVLRADTDPMGVAATANGTLNHANNTIGIQDAGLIAAYRPGDIATAMGVRTINNATGDIAFSVQANEVDAHKPNEGAAVAQEGATFTEVKLQPVRYAAYTRVTEQLLAQTADDMGSFMARDIRAALDEKYNDDVHAAILAAATTAASGADSLGDILDIEADMLTNDIPLENVRVLAGAGAYRQAREVSMDAGSGLLIAGSPAGRRSVLGYDATVSSSVTSANIYMVDNANMVQCNWGGLNILVDPYTNAENGVVRMVCNVYKDFKVLNDAGFHGLTSFDGA